VDELETRSQEFLKNAEHLKQKMKHKQEKIAEQVESALRRAPLTFNPRKVPTNIDEEDPALNETTLPSPLKPEVVSVLKPANESVQPQQSLLAPGELDKNLEAQLEDLVHVSATVSESAVAVTNLREFLDDRPLTP
jgi:hypothetical protein